MSEEVKPLWERLDTLGAETALRSMYATGDYTDFRVLFAVLGVVTTALADIDQKVTALLQKETSK